MLVGPSGASPCYLPTQCPTRRALSRLQRVVLFLSLFTLPLCSHLPSLAFPTAMAGKRQVMQKEWERRLNEVPVSKE